MVLFIVFDVEIALILVVPAVIPIWSPFIIAFFNLFLIVLLIGVFY